MFFNIHFGAWHTDHHYGTITCDLERSEVIDILPDHAKCYREAAT